MGKNKYKKIGAKFLIELTLPNELLNTMKIEDRRRLEDLNRLDLRWKAGDSKTAFIFELGDIFKVRNVLNEYNYRVVYPERKELKRYGLSYSGESLSINKNGNDFIIEQQFPDGRIETHIIPANRVWRVYYIIKHYFENNPKADKVETPILWRNICIDFNINRYFDRSGKFHKNSFFGDRRTYFDFAYFPMKVLDHLGKIVYKGKYISLPKKDD